MEQDAPSVGAARSRLAPGLSHGWVLLVAAAIFAADQVSKYLVRAWLDFGERWPAEGPFRLVHVTNSGAAFGMLQGAGPLLGLVSLAGVAIIFVYLYNPAFAHPALRLGLALMLGGAAGNLSDRFREGEVVDFLKVPQWPAFNLADSAISVGVVLLLWAMLWRPPDRAAGS